MFRSSAPRGFDASCATQATTYPGSYSDYARQKSTAIAMAMAAWEKQQKEIERQTELILRLAGTGQAGRAEAAKKALEKIQSEEELLQKPWVEKRRPFRFPEPPRSGRIVVRVDGLVHGYGNRRLIKDANLLVERGERLALVVRPAHAAPLSRYPLTLRLHPASRRAPMVAARARYAVRLVLCSDVWLLVYVVLTIALRRTAVPAPADGHGKAAARRGFNGRPHGGGKLLRSEPS